jgi:hypothetical protein
MPVYTCCWRLRWLFAPLPAGIYEQGISQVTHIFSKLTIVLARKAGPKQSDSLSLKI